MIVRGAILGGVVVALLLASAGILLGVTLPPWNWSSPLADSYGRAVEWLRAAGILLPPVVVASLLIALMCAFVFEFVTHRAGWWVGALVGLVAGICGSAIVGLVPWFAWWYGYSYMPSLAPIGTADPAIALVVLASMGIVIGAIVGAFYGVPRHTVSARPAVRWREVYTTPEVRR